MREMKMKALEDLIRKMYELEADEHDELQPHDVQSVKEDHGLKELQSDYLDEEEDRAVEGDDKNPAPEDQKDDMKNEMLSFMKAGKKLPTSKRSGMQVAVSVSRPKRAY